MKKNRVTFVAMTLAGILGVTALAAGAKSITADLRPDIRVRIDGVEQTMVDKNGNVVHPITYEGTTYLPIRAIGNLMDYDVNWDSKGQTVILDRKTNTKPEDLTLEKLTVRVQEAEQSIAAFKPAATYAERVEQYSLHSRTLDALRTDVGDFVQLLSDRLNKGEITNKDYNVLINQSSDLDRRLKNALIKLAAKTIDDESGKLSVAEQAKVALNALEKQIKAQETAIANLNPAKTYDERVEQYNAMSVEMTRLNKAVSTMYTNLNDHLRNGRLSYSEYNTLSSQCGKLDERMKGAWENLRAKTINLSDETTKPETGNKTYDSYLKEINDLDKKVDQLAKDVENYKPAKGDKNNKQAYRNLENRIEKLEHELDRLEDNMERSYRQDALTYAQYKELDRLEDKVENKLDRLDDQLEDKLDRWDNDHDDDYDDDDWDD